MGFEPVTVVRYSEIAVKGPSTRRKMEELLASNIEDALRANGLGGRVVIAEGRLYIVGADPRRAALAASRVFGVKSASPASRVRARSLREIVEAGKEFFCDRVRGKVFRVRARRAGSHDFTSKDIERELGAALLRECGAARVNLTSPEYTAYVEVRGDEAYFYDEVIAGPGGLPLGSEDRVAVLFSGGFDSTVAAWLVMRRGSPVTLVFYDFGDEEFRSNAIEAAVALAKLWGYGFPPDLAVVDFRPAIDKLKAVAPEYRVLVARRLMLEHAYSKLRALGAMALATGENIGQVASQTINNLSLIGRGIGPVLRPVAGFDKDEVTEYSRRIGLYEVNSRQIEVCGRDSPPTPRADEAVFWREYRRLGELAGKLPMRVFGLPADTNKLLGEIRSWLGPG